MKSILLGLILLFAALPVSACDPSYPKGIHGHKLNSSYTIEVHYSVSLDPKEKDPNPNKTAGEIMTTLLNKLVQANRADFSFNRVDKDLDANLVFHIHILHDEKQRVFVTHIEVYGMGKPIRLFSVNGVAKDDEATPALRSFAHAIAQVYLMIDKGWSCGTPSEDTKLDQNVGKALNF